MIKGYDQFQKQFQLIAELIIDLADESCCRIEVMEKLKIASKEAKNYLNQLEKLNKKKNDKKISDLINDNRYQLDKALEDIYLAYNDQSVESQQIYNGKKESLLFMVSTLIFIMILNSLIQF
ncbi:hypothetical protein pb186bvf_002494 [Paramecium bursaria]